MKKSTRIVAAMTAMAISGQSEMYMPTRGRSHGMSTALKSAAENARRIKAAEEKRAMRLKRNTLNN